MSNKQNNEHVPNVTRTLKCETEPKSLLNGECLFFFFSISEILHTVFLTAILILSSLCRYIPTIAVLHVFCEQ